MAKLEVVTNGLAGLSHEVTGTWATIGRADETAFQIVEPSISGRHCEVRLQAGELAVRDLDSTNGTFVHGQKITDAVLKPGQILRVGDVDLRFEAVVAALSPVPFVNTMLLKAGSPGTAPALVVRPPPGHELGKKYHVLLVDDNHEFLEVFGELCSAMANQTWEIYRATSADRALVVLQQHPIDLAVLDIGMPLVDGLQLLGIISRRYPGVKLAVMTGLATESNRAAGLANGAELFIEKPISADETKVVFNMLNDLVSWPHREGFSGTLRQVGLQEVIQLECTGRRSLILEIRNQQMRGQIYIENGSITHAEAGDLVGDQALNRLLSLTGGEFQLKPFQSPPHRTVEERWEMLLMEAARQCDEDTAFIVKKTVERSAKAPAPEETPAKEERCEEEEADPADDDFVVVATYDGQWSSAANSTK